MVARNKNTCVQPGEGRLPACTPLAVPFVPFQEETAPKYDAEKGIVRGTLFPGLDLPFMEMYNKSTLPDKPIHELQALSFAIQELTLYLDTHRDDTDAVELLRAYQELYQRGKAEYEKCCGPLDHTSMAGGSKFSWLNDPWPWDYQEPR